LCRQGIVRSGIIWFGPIENVGELRPDSKGGAFFDAELAAHTDVLYGAALVPVAASIHPIISEGPQFGTDLSPVDE
jgi:hypothetical protein